MFFVLKSLFYGEQNLISDAFSFQEWSPEKGDQSEEEREQVCDGYTDDVEEELQFSKSAHCEYC